MTSVANRVHESAATASGQGHCLCVLTSVSGCAQLMFDDYARRGAEVPAGMDYYGCQMLACPTLHEPFAVTYVNKFLMHSATWRGQVARTVKAALRGALKTHARLYPPGANDHGSPAGVTAATPRER